MTCKYRNCRVELPADSLFPYCDGCRSLDNADRVRLILDPLAPNRPAHTEYMLDVMITQMTGDEVMRFQSNLEFLYLEMCKVVLRLKPAQGKRVKMTVQEAIDEARTLNENGSIRVKQVVKSTEKRAKTKAKLTTDEKRLNLLGCSAQCRADHDTGKCPHVAIAKSMFEADLNDL